MPGNSWKTYQCYMYRRCVELGENRRGEMAARLAGQPRLQGTLEHSYLMIIGQEDQQGVISATSEKRSVEKSGLPCRLA